MAAKPAVKQMTSADLKEISIEFSIGDLEVATEKFDESRRLGAGAYGAVYRAEMKDGSQAAIKLIDLQKLGMDSSASGFEEEVAILSKFRHPNLILLMGWARTDTCRFLVYEFLSGGDVSVRLQKCKRPPPHGKAFTWQDRLSVSLDAATGLAYLHNAKPHAYHRDIKSANILLDANGTGAKMADFGLSFISNVQKTSFISAPGSGPARPRISSSAEYVSPCGTPGYICPIYLKRGRITEGSEVYSFGIVFLEILINLFPSLITPAGGLCYPIYEAVRFEEPGAAERAAARADRAAAWPPVIAAEVAALALQCIDSSEVNRPSFNDVCRTIRSIQSTDLSLHEPEPDPTPRRTTFATIARTIYKTASDGSDATPRRTRALSTPIVPPSELILDAVHVCTFPHGSPAELRKLRLKPTVQASGRCVVQIGRDKQGHWFRQLLIDENLVVKNIAEAHLEISWDVSGAGVVLNATVERVGNLPVFLDNVRLTLHHAVPVKEGSQLMFLDPQGSLKGMAVLILAIGFSSDGFHTRSSMSRFEVEAAQRQRTMSELMLSAATTESTCADRCCNRCTLQ